MHTNDGHGYARTTMSGFLKTCCLLLSFFILVACGTTKPATVDSQLTKQEGYEQTRDGVRIYIRPLQDINEIKKYFGANLLKKGILPIFVLAENKSEAASFLVEPADRHEPLSQDKQNPKTDESAVSGTDYISAEDARKAVYEKEVEVGYLYSSSSLMIPAETVVMVSHNSPNQSLRDELKDFAGQIHVVGDSSSPLFLMNAIHGGYNAGSVV